MVLCCAAVRLTQMQVHGHVFAQLTQLLCRPPAPARRFGAHQLGSLQPTAAEPRSAEVDGSRLLSAMSWRGMVVICSVTPAATQSTGDSRTERVQSPVIR